MNASDLMTRDVASVRTGTSIADAVRLMLTQRVSGLPVLDEAGRVVGIITEGDLLRRPELGTDHQPPGWLDFLRSPGAEAADYARTHAHKVGDAMTQDVVTVAEDTPAETIVSLMQEHRIKRLPVLRNEQVIGIVSRADLLRALLPTLARNPAAHDPAAQEFSDDELCHCIELAFTRERWAPRQGVKVECKAGAVTLSGVIFEERDREALRVLAESIQGVKSVRDALVWVDPTSGITAVAGL